MADKNEFDSRPNQIPRDVQGSDSSIPLSPQWLLPKTGENKSGADTGGNHFSRLPGNVNSPVAVEPTGAGDPSIDNNKKKNVFRPSVLDMESGRRDRWRDEERDTNSSVRKDRWEREHADNRRVDRKAELSGGHHVESRRAPGERWTDTGNKDNHEQHRESKWSTRWGHDDKDAESVREKWGDSNKEDAVLLDKGPSHGKDEREGDHYRPWRPNSSYSRGRTDSHHQNLTPNKQVHTFSHGRGRGENPAFFHGRGRVGSGGNSVTYMADHLSPHRPLVEKGEPGCGESYPLTYNRTKLIDIYRTTDMETYGKYLEGVVQVPSLTQEQPVEPLAFSSPSPEELIILNGIDKGEITSSGAPQVGKDGPAGRTTTEFMQTSRNRLGSGKDNLHFPPNNSEGLSHEKHIHRLPNAKRETMQEYRASSDHKLNAEERSLSTSMDIPNDLNNVWKNSTVDSPNTNKGAPKWQSSDDPFTRRKPSGAAMNKEMEPHISSHPSPEDLVLYYMDPQGEIQGPFAGSDIITWFESGYFGIELQVRLASASAESPFSLLGDVMPHLRAKSRAPPGFNAPKANEIQDTSGKLDYNSSGKVHAVASESDLLKNDQRYQHGLGSTETENRFLESLMAGGLSTAPFDKFGLSEGMQGYGRTNFIARPPLGSNIGDDPYLLAKKLALERQRSIPNPYSLWPGRDAASLSSITDLRSEKSLPKSEVLSSITDNISIVNNGISDWMNFPNQGGLDSQDKSDIRHTPNIPPHAPLGLIQQRLQPQNASLSNLLAQSLDNSSRTLTPEKLQDPQILSLLQQQYLLQQVQSQAPVAPQQLLLLDMMLKQQQKQEEQQQLMRQQQQLLSQVLSEHHHNQPSAESSFSQLQSGGFAAGNDNVDHAFQQHRDTILVGSQEQASRDESSNAADFVLPRGDSQDKIGIVGSENSMLLPHQMFANTSKQTDDMDTTQMSKFDESVGVSTAGLASRFPAREPLGEPVPRQLHTNDYKNQLLFHDKVEALAETPAGALDEQDIGDSSVVKEVKNSVAREVKKSPEKKTKKQKPLKVPSDSVRAVSKSHPSEPSESGAISCNAKSEAHTVKGDVLAASVTEKKAKTKKVVDDVGFLPGQTSLPAFSYADDGFTIETKVQPREVANTSQPAQRAWKPAPGFKPRSLLEIQQEEQRKRAEEESAVSDISAPLISTSVSTVWDGMIVNADHKEDKIPQDAASTEINLPKSVSSSTLKKKNSQSEDLFWDSFGDRELDTSNSGVPLTSIISSQPDTLVDDDFIDAKDTKKSRKKSAKAKTAGAKNAPTVVASPVTNDKDKHARKMQQQKEVLPSLPSGPSFADFVTWKGESASPPAPAWSDYGEQHKTASLRDILKEQEKKVFTSVPTPQKSASDQPARASGPSWSYSSSPAKAASPVTINPQASSQPKHNKVEDDLFWGPIEQPKQDDKQSEFPHLGTQSKWGSKSIPVKGTVGGTSNRHKSTGVKPAADYSVSASLANLSLKGKKKSVSKHSEASDFRLWCESECIRLIGSKDTSILEYCLKISRSEAETLLIENLGSLDPNHEFIDKFLSYKDFLPADVVDIAFKNPSDRKSSPEIKSYHVDDTGGSELVSVGAADGITKVGGKKKGKKGKKVSASVLGFNVVSNRIMMGEIQTADE